MKLSLTEKAVAGVSLAGKMKFRFRPVKFVLHLVLTSWPKVWVFKLK